MKREKDLFEVEQQLRRFYQNAKADLQKAIKEEEKEYDCEKQVEKLLKKLEELDKQELRQISENSGKEELAKKSRYLLEEIEEARKDLREGNLYELKDYLNEVEEILEDSGFTFPEEENNKRAHYFIGNALHGVNTAIEYQEVEGELEGHTQKLLKRIESADKQEIKRIQDNLESDNIEEGFEVELEEKCRQLWKETEKTREHIENEDYREALEYVQEVGKLLEAIEIDLDHVLKLHEKYEVDFENPMLKNVVYPLKDRDDLLIKFQGSLRECKKLKKFIDQLPEDVNIARIVEVGLYSGEPIGHDEPAQIIEKVSGYQVQHADDDSELLSIIAEAPQKHFDKLVRDSEAMIKHGLVPDASDNLFYNRERGFVWIDPLRYDITDRIEKGLDNDRFNYFAQTVPMRYAGDQEDKGNGRKVFSKLEEAGAPQRDKSLEQALEDFLEGRDIDTPDWMDES